MYDKAILHLDLDTFFVSVERLRNSKLEGKPVLVGGKSRRGVVASCSYEARHFGVHAGMPMRMALRLCPEAILVKGDMDVYSKYSSMVTDVVDDAAPIFEKASIDEFYLDLTGMDQHIGCGGWSSELRHTIIRETGLPISVGLSINKLVSKVSTGEAKPNGMLRIDPGKEKLFFAPLSISKIPSVGKKTFKKLSFMGVRTIDLLSKIPVRLLENEFGKTGISLHKKANAIDNSPVVPFHEKKSISKERTFQLDTIDIRFLKAKFVKMVSHLAFELRNSERLTSVITVKVRYTDFNTYTKQKKIPYTANDKTLNRYVDELFEKLYERRQLVRLIGVKFGGLVQGCYQLSLLDDSVRDIQLLQAMDKVRARFGKDAVMLGGGV